MGIVTNSERRTCARPEDGPRTCCPQVNRTLDRKGIHLSEVEPAKLAALAAVISALVALVSATVGPFVSWKFAKKQIASTLRSASRRDWIDTLREEVAELLGLMWDASARRVGGTLDSPSVDEFSRAISKKLAKIELLLNPNEELHNRLVWLIRETLAEVWNPEKTPYPERARELTDSIVQSSKEILKAEWDRAKAGD